MPKSHYFQMAVKQVEDASAKGVVVIEGFASTPDLDRYRDIVEPKAFDNALAMFMKNPVMLYQHDPNRPVGTFTSVTVTDKGLKVRAEINDLDTQEKVKDGRLRALSIGYIPLSTELQHEDGTPFNFEEDSIWDSSLIRVIKALDLVEISIVSTPANGNALFTMAKSLEAFTKKLALKSFIDGKVSSKEVDGDAPENEVDSDAPEAVPTADEVPAEEAPTEAKETEPVAPVETETPAEPAAPVEEPVAPAAEEPKPSENQEEAKETVPENAENAGETPAAEGGEGGAIPAEKPIADAAPESGTDDADDSQGKAIIVAKDVASVLTELKDSGLIREAVGEEKPVAITKATMLLMRKLLDLIKSENDRAETEAKRAETLQGKLNAIPEKKALAPHAQFDPVDPTGKATPKNAPKENSQWFKSLFKI